jgi:drug/metabolite transporter (DMT)-like permease
LTQQTQENTDNIKLAVGAIVLAVFALALGDAVIKQSSVNFTLWQIFVVRSAIAIPFLIWFVRLRTCAAPIMPQRLFWTILRSLILVLMWIIYYISLPHVALSIAAAAYYTLPIFITLIAALFLGDRIGHRGWAAVTLGFAGVILILRPQADDFNSYALLPIGSAICYALAMILTRTKCRNEKPQVLSLWLNVSFVSVGLLMMLIIQLWEPSLESMAANPFLLGEWLPMWNNEWRIMALLAVAIIVGSIFAAIAYQSGPPAMIATFDFSYVAFATILGFMFFGEVPDLVTVIGMLLIVGGGIVAVKNQNSGIPRPD